MQFEPTAIADVILIRPKVFGDPRGYFFESWEERKFAAGGIAQRFVQDNHSHSERHVLRGVRFALARGACLPLMMSFVLPLAGHFLSTATQSNQKTPPPDSAPSHR